MITCHLHLLAFFTSSVKELCDGYLGVLLLRRSNVIAELPCFCVTLTPWALAFKQSSLDRGQEEVSLEKPLCVCILRKQCALYCENKKCCSPHISLGSPVLAAWMGEPSCAWSDRAIHPRDPQGRSNWEEVKERLVLQ